LRVSQIRQHPVCPYKTLTTFRVTITAIAAAKQASRAIPGKVASLAKQKVDDAKKVMADTLLEERASAEAVRTEIENEVERELSEAQNAIDEAKAGARVSISHPTQSASLIAHTRPAKGLLRLKGRIPSNCYPDCLRNTNPSYTWSERLTFSC
jgi:hypothetical protein